MPDIRIPDVSNYQPNVDWPQVIASGRAGGISKASEGMNFVDATFTRNWKVLGDLGAVRGAYHFARPGSSLPAQQALRFLGAVKTWKAGDILVLDLEVGDGNLSSWALGWLHEVQAQTGIVPWLYSYAPFIRAHLTDPALAAFPLWLAAYQAKPPLCPQPWKTYVLWQHTDKASIPGIRGGCDESVGDIAVLSPGPSTPGRQPATAAVQAPTSKEVSGVRISAGMIGPVNLDPEGKGWVSIGAPLDHVLFVEERGSAPVRDKGYWANVSHDVNDSGSETIVTLYGAPGEEVVVYYKLLLEE